jgi:hypothetical protein
MSNGSIGPAAAAAAVRVGMEAAVEDSRATGATYTGCGSKEEVLLLKQLAAAFALAVV